MNDGTRMDRREALKWIAAASATISVLDLSSFAKGVAAKGYGTDPNLVDSYKPGDFWPLTFTREQHRLVSVLCDVILPADEKSPSATELKVPDFLDEWVSAPYPYQQSDRELILRGLDWLEGEAHRRFQKGFADLTAAQHTQICDDICSVERAGSGMEAGAKFFSRFRDLAMGGFYSTPAGFKDLQYLGNVPLTKFDGPPPEVLAYLKL